MKKAKIGWIALAAAVLAMFVGIDYFTLSATAITDVWADYFQPSGTGRTTNALPGDGDEKLFGGGSFTTAGGVSAPGDRHTDKRTDYMTVDIDHWPMNGIRGVAIGPNYSVAADPGDTVFFTHTVASTGLITITDVYNIQAVNAAGWTTIVDPAILLVAQLISDNVVITMAVPNAAAGVENETTVTVTSSSNITVTDTATDIITVIQVFGVEIVNDESRTASPGTTVVYTHTVTNKGNGLDTFDITTASDQGYTTTSTSFINLAADESQIITATIDIPAGVTPGVVDKTTVTATSRGSGNPSDDVVDTTTVVCGFPGPSEVEPNSSPIDANGPLCLDHLYEGSAYDDWPELESDWFYIELLDAGPFMIDVTGFEPLDGQLQLFYKTSANLVAFSAKRPGEILRIDYDGADGKYLIRIVSPAGSPFGTELYNLIVRTFDSAPGVEIVKDETSTASPGTTVEYVHTVTNMGNGTDTFDIISNSDQGYTVTVPAPLTLGPGLSDTIAISIEIPAGESAGKVDKTTITATSRGSGNPSDSVVDTTTVAEILGVDIKDDESATADPGTTAVYTHTVTNQGNAIDTYNISASSAQGFVTRVSPTSMTLKKDENGLVGVEIDTPASAGSNVVDKTTVTAASEKNASVKDDVTDTTNINQVFGIEILKNEVLTASPGTTVVYEQTVTNKGNGTDTIDITANSDQDYTTTLAPAILNLNAGQSQKIKVSITVPTGVSDGTVDKTTVTATSRGSANATGDIVNTTTINWHSLFIPIVNAPSEWIQVGANSWGGEDHATSIDVCRSDSDLIFAGTEDTVRLFDGNSWTTITGDVPKGGDISSIVMNESCNSVYVVVFKGSQDQVIDAHGVWEGKLNNEGNWIWQELTGGIDVALARKVVLSEGTLFAGGGFGISYWENRGWQSTFAPGTPSHPIMNMTVADPENQTGPVYAVQWFNPRIYRNSDPKNSPANWSVIGGISDLPDLAVRAVIGDKNNVVYVGTSSGHYRLSGSSWMNVLNQSPRTFILGSNNYAGYANNAGVYMADNAGIDFRPYNQGWSPPENVAKLVFSQDRLYAATTSGVFRR